MTNVLLLCLLSYLLGSISFAVLVSWVFALPDPRSYGSGNPGATNVLRTGKKLPALLTLLGDASKGALAIWLARASTASLGQDEPLIAAVAFSAFLGHLFPLFHRFRGGKGVATAAGIFLALYWPFGLTLIGIWLLVFALSRVSSLSALSAAVSAPPLAAYFFGASANLALTACMTILLIWRHRSNLAMLLAGKESHVGSGGTREKSDQA